MAAVTNLTFAAGAVSGEGAHSAIDSRQAGKIEKGNRFVSKHMREFSQYLQSLELDEKAQVLFKMREVVVLVDGEKKSFEVPDHLKKQYHKLLVGAVSFLECTDARSVPEVGELQGDPKEKFDGVKKGAQPTCAQNIMAGLNAVDGGLSLARQIFNVKEGPTNLVSAILGFFSGSIWFLGALLDIKGGYSGSEYSEEIGDNEGKRRAQAQMASGGLGAIGAGFFLGSKTTSVEAAGTGVVTALSNVATAGFGAVSLLGMGTASLGIYRCYRFQERLDEVMEGEKSEGNKIRAALRYLKSLLAIHPLEKQAIENQIESEYPGIEQEDKNELVEEKLRHLAETKIKYLKRRTSSKAVEQILKQTDALLEEYEAGVVGKEKIEAAALIALVKSESKKKIVLFAWTFVAWLLSFVASILFLAAVVSTVPYILMGLSTLIFLVIIIRGICAKFKDSSSARAEGSFVHGAGSGK